MLSGQAEGETLVQIVAPTWPRNSREYWYHSPGLRLQRARCLGSALPVSVTRELASTPCVVAATAVSASKSWTLNVKSFTLIDPTCIKHRVMSQLKRIKANELGNGLLNCIWNFDRRKIEGTKDSFSQNFIARKH